MSLLRVSATELAKKIRIKELSPVEVVRAHIERIEAVNPAINAVIVDRYDAALVEAREAERRVMRDAPEDLPPFHGVPCTIKAAFALEGMPWTCGLESRSHVVAREDGLTVARLRGAGAIPVGQTNVPEGLMWYETYNSLYGRTGNPYDPRCTAGGSSGGEGSTVGAGGVPFGLGSDVAGSIRLPAFFCGVFGHKPSGGRVPCTGQFPPTDGPRARFLSTGPLTRRAEDLLPLTRILADTDWTSSNGHTRPLEPSRFAHGDLKGLKVYVAEDNGRMPVTGIIKKKIRAAAKALEDRGARVEEWRHPSLRKSLELWLGMMEEVPGWTFSMILGNGQPIRLRRELVKAAFRRSVHITPSLALCVMEATTPTGTPWMQRCADEARQLKQDLDERLGDDGVLLHPTFPRTAMRHRVAMLRPYEFAYTAIFNVLQLPVTCVPMGLDDRGLPTGLQVVGAEGRDALTMGVAQPLEEDFGGWVAPPGT